MINFEPFILLWDIAPPNNWVQVYRQFHRGTARLVITRGGRTRNF